ncbi:hypothetical protein MKY25_15015 [Geobacillus sp. FSL W8-0032]|uniref:Lipoprotein n=1 Tax=Geobacillus subterraneus TaxID=129338 RepID=A0A679FQQ0_9BACL|nr:MULTISPECIES: hypothetical protein [Geobacillus]KYD28850.1 hypothetical protein B4113_3647 [Geobacillus sp. B4113_201601]BBW97369.1 hypothetical protein GsuE55_22020 [Geobacillus subterraneus]
MFRYWQSLISIVAAAILLAGCGADSSPPDKAEAKAKQTASSGEHRTHPQATEPANQNSTAASGQHSTGNGQDKTAGKEPASSRSTTSLSYQKGKQIVTGTATLTVSDNQHFSLYVLDGWTLDAEEPNADVLLHGKTFARIRLLHDKEIDYEQLAKEHAQAVNSSAARRQAAQLPAPFQDAVWYTAQADGVTVHVIASAQPAPLLLTVHAPDGEDALGAVLAMVATLQRQ